METKTSIVYFLEDANLSSESTRSAAWSVHRHPKLSMRNTIRWWKIGLINSGLLEASRSIDEPGDVHFCGMIIRYATEDLLDLAPQWCMRWSGAVCISNIQLHSRWNEQWRRASINRENPGDSAKCSVKFQTSLRIAKLFVSFTGEKVKVGRSLSYNLLPRNWSLHKRNCLKRQSRVSFPLNCQAARRKLRWKFIRAEIAMYWKFWTPNNWSFDVCWIRGVVST